MLILINGMILLGFIGLSLAALFWKHFAKSPKEAAQAVIATVVGTAGIILFFLQVAIMTVYQGQNLITFMIEWLTNH